MTDGFLQTSGFVFSDSLLIKICFRFIFDKNARVRDPLDI